MKRGAIIFCLGLILGALGFAGVYYLGTASYRSILHDPQPELAWLKTEFKLSAAEFARISRLHDEYRPRCEVRCRLIAQQNQKLRELFAHATSMTSEIQDVLAARAATRAECEAEMMKHFMEVSRTMPPAQGRRYLAWVEQQTFLHGQAMEQQHQHSGNPHVGHSM